MLQQQQESGDIMKKTLTALAILGGIAAVVAIKLKKDEEKKIKKLEEELLAEENECSCGNDEGGCCCGDETCSCEESEEGCCCGEEETCCCGEEPVEQGACCCQENGDEATCCNENSACECEQDKASDRGAETEFPYLSSESKQEMASLNDNIIEELNRNGDVNSNERPIQHIIEFTSVEDMEAFKTAVISKGFVVARGNSDLEVLVLHVSSIDRVALLQNIYYLANQALAHHGKYRGWKSRVYYQIKKAVEPFFALRGSEVC